MRSEPNGQENGHTKGSKYGGTYPAVWGRNKVVDVKFDPVVKGKSIPVLALIDPAAGCYKVGQDFLNIARRCPVYQDRFFNIHELAQDTRRGGLMDVFRLELMAAKEEAREMKTRARVISGGTDAHAAYALRMILRALQADNTRFD